ncbi:MAG: LytTR family transcriptional regulator DNA-binding domain-containing protein [Lachnospiraceae bacterium]|jgi:DNA-binding LytR/AlgR family response regulator|nr:LytTR family transcriptional regulator DNA-binding domain-containing protein [Lachnospiraceae bacterium]
MIKIVICDNHEDDIKTLKANIERIAGKNNINVFIDIFTSSTEFLNAFHNTKDFGEIIFLDTDLKGMDGLHVAEELRNQGFEDEIIFYSRNKPEVFHSFDVDAFHYIIKDETSIERQEEILRYAYREIEKKRRDYITLSCAGESISIPLVNIHYFIVKNRIITVYYGKNKSFEFYGGLGKITNSIVSKGFVRISNNILLNFNYIEKRTKTDLILKDGETVKISRAMSKEANTLIDKFQKKRELFRM